MREINYRTFEIEHPGRRVPFMFAVRTRADGILQITRISPYDETDYHWAMKSPDCRIWHVIRNGRIVSTIRAFRDSRLGKIVRAYTPEEVAHFLIEADRKANLTPRFCCD